MSLQNILGTAQQVVQTAQMPKDLAYQKQMRDLQMRAQEQGLDDSLRRMQREGLLTKMIEWKALPQDQKEPFLNRFIQEWQMQGKDPSGLVRFRDLTPEQRDIHADVTLAAAERMGQIGGTRSPSPTSAIQNYQFRASLTPEQQKQFDATQRSQPGFAVEKIGGETGIFARGTGQFTPKTTAEQEREVAAAERGAVTTATEEAKRSVERQAGRAARFEKARQTVASIDNVIGKALEAEGKTGATTAGWGSFLSILPGSDAKELQSLLTVVQGNLGFDRLQQMRDASPTGGALGQVSERELQFLQSTVSSLDPRLDPPVLRKNLREIAESYQRWRDAVIEARGRDLVKDGMSNEQAIEQLRKEFPSG